MSVYSVLFAGGEVFDVFRVVGRVAVLALVVAAGVLLIAVRFELVHAATSHGDSTASESKVNCPSCGARTTVDADGCGYCGEPIDR